jgi:GT2 family glycosyltransferase
VTARDIPLAEAISVVIPVFNAAEELQGCLQSVHATVPGGTRVVIIDDASPDVSTRRVLSDWQRRAPSSWSFHANAENCGFVATANRGMRLTRNNVVLLNSDTEVTPGWLDGLQNCLASDPSIGTATPWTNNGEIVSLPGFCEANPVPSDAASLARVITAMGRPVYPDIPTAVGFCMAVARSAIEQVGLFDEDLFGRGYGEENDFSMRVRKAGMRNVLCDDVYVVHLGGRSFGPIGLRPDDSSMQRLLSRHPDYLKQVQAFISADPLSARRTAIVKALRRAGVSLG